MVQITLNDEQAKLVAQSEGMVELRDLNGKLLGYFKRAITDEDLAIALRSRASKGPRYTTEEVFAYLRSLESK